MLNRSWFIREGEIPSIDLQGGDVRFPIELPKKIIEAFTKKGDVVLDPFAGFGTTLFAAQELGRIAVGLEYEKERADFIASRLTTPSQIIHGDSRRLSEYDIPRFDLCFTSPPYMRSFDLENPLTNYSEAGDYEVYLRSMVKVFEQVKQRMNPGAHVLVEIENTFEKGVPMTTLAWDLGKALSGILFLEREIICCVEGNLETSKVTIATSSSSKMRTTCQHKQKNGRSRSFVYLPSTVNR